MNACPYCAGAVSDLTAGIGERAHLYCPGCGAHGYGPRGHPKWWSRREWSAWIEEGPMGSRALDGAA